MKYDDASWHYGGEAFSEDLDEKQGAVHIGFFFGWAIEAGIIGEFHTEENQEMLEQFRTKKKSPADIFMWNCDGKLTDEDFDDVGNQFVKEYYASDDKVFSYLMDYSTQFWEYELIYTVEDNWENYEKIKIMLDKRFKLWRKLNKI